MLHRSAHIRHCPRGHVLGDLVFGRRTDIDKAFVDSRTKRLSVMYAQAKRTDAFVRRELLGSEVGNREANCKDIAITIAVRCFVSYGVDRSDFMYPRGPG